MVYYDLITGRPPDIATTLRRRISALTRQGRVRAFKLGITNNPSARYSNAYGREYDLMIVVYRSSSINFVSQMECDLIEHNRQLADNRIGGGGGNYGEGPYYLYIVLSW